LILPNEDFLRAAEALRLHNFTALETTQQGNPHHVDGLENYAAQYLYPSEITQRLGDSITVALFPASLLGWKLVYIPVPDQRDRNSFTTSLAIEKIPIPLEWDVAKSFIQLSLSQANLSDAASVKSEGTTSTVAETVRADETDDEYVVVAPVRAAPAVRRGSVAMERGNGVKSPMESVCDITDMKPEPGTGAVEMLPGQMMLEKSEGQLTMVIRGLYVPRKDSLKDSFRQAGEFLRRDGMHGTAFGKLLKGWSNLVGEPGSRRNSSW
jgi:hypothetical protein